MLYVTFSMKRSAFALCECGRGAPDGVRQWAEETPEASIISVSEHMHWENWLRPWLMGTGGGIGRGDRQHNW